MMRACPLCLSKYSQLRYEIERKKIYAMHECLECGHIFMMPQPSKADLQSFYTEDYYYDDYFSEEIAKQSYGFFRELRQYLKPGKRVLDLGCSKGFFLYFAKQAGCDCEGVEMSNDAVKYARSIIGAQKIHQASVEDVKLPNDYYDVITGFDIIEHVLDPTELLRKMSKWLKPGGVIILDTPNYDSLYRKISQERWMGFDMPFHIHLFRKKTVSNMAKKANLNIKDLYTTHFNILSKEGWVRSKGFGLYVLMVKLLKLFGYWKKVSGYNLINPVAQDNLKPTSQKKLMEIKKPRIGLRDMFETGLNAPINATLGKWFLLGDGLRVVLTKKK